MKMNLNAGTVQVLQVIVYFLIWAVNHNGICSYADGDGDDDVYDGAYVYLHEILIYFYALCVYDDDNVCDWAPSEFE